VVVVVVVVVFENFLRDPQWVTPPAIQLHKGRPDERRLL